MGPGGDFEGYTVVIQGDQAVPHEDGDFKNIMIAYCNERNWLWCAQGPQMPTSIWRSFLLYQSGIQRWVLRKDEIWASAWKVWCELPSSKIAAGYILASKLAEKVIQDGGSNKCVGSQGMLHSGVSRAFRETDRGLVKKGAERRGKGCRVYLFDLFILLFVQAPTAVGLILILSGYLRPLEYPLETTTSAASNDTSIPTPTPTGIESELFGRCLKRQACRCECRLSFTSCRLKIPKYPGSTTTT